jgi:hypothetical protein
MAGPGKTLGSPWPPLAIRPCCRWQTTSTFSIARVRARASKRSSSFLASCCGTGRESPTTPASCRLDCASRLPKRPSRATCSGKVGNIFTHGCMARGGHGLPKVSHGPVMPYPSMPCKRATPETALCPFQELPTRRAGGLQPSSTSIDTPRPTPMFSVSDSSHLSVSNRCAV